MNREPKFKAGDVVMLVSNQGGYWHLDKLGKVCTITGVVTWGCETPEYVTSFGFGNIVESRLAPCPVVNVIESLVETLEDILEKYVSLVNSGDAGFWNPEEVPEVIKARSVLNRTKGIKDE